MRILALILAGIVMALPALGQKYKIHPVAGKVKQHTVQKGETLFMIARRHNVSMPALMRLNGLRSERVKPGKRLTLPTLYVLPRTPGTGIVLNLPERAAYVFKSGSLQGRYPVAVGTAAWPTAQGQYTLRRKVVNPSWKPTKEMVQREQIKDEIVPPGKENPMGDRWMGWSLPGYGFHSTTKPRSVGRAISHGCVRLYPEAAHRMYEQVSEGMPIYSVYEPVLVGKLNGRYFLSLSPDIYHKGLTTLPQVKARLKRVGLLPLVEEKELRRIIARADGHPHRISGASEDLVVNGEVIRSKVRPTMVRRQWVVPLQDTVKALGGKVAASPNGAITVKGNSRSFVFRPGQTSAMLNGKGVKLAVAPTVVEGVSMAPLSVLKEMFGAKVAIDRGKAVRVTTGASGTRTTARRTPL
jgi:L,D-transpeptidase ErfK/SrfK